MQEVATKGEILLVMAAILCVSLLSIRSTLISDFGSARKRLLALFMQLLGGFNSVWLFVWCCIVDWKTFYLHGFALGFRNSFMSFVSITCLVAAFCVGVPLFALLVLKLATRFGLDGILLAEESLKVVPEESR